MIELPWEYTGPGRWHCTFANYIFKRKGSEGAYKYEVWKGEELINNTIDYYGCIKEYMWVANRFGVLDKETGKYVDVKGKL